MSEINDDISKLEQLAEQLNAKKPLKRILLDSIIEINNLSPQLFDSNWVNIFNKVIKKLYRERKVFGEDDWH